MARGIILAMEEYEGTDPNDFDFSDFEPVMGSEGTDLISEMDSAIEATDDLDTHMEITDIIATEGVGNTPQIAAIALSALETRLFGQPVVGTQVGTESRTTIAIESKNIFIRAWEAISKFFKKMWEKIQSVFGEDKKKKTKKKAKQVKEAKVDQATGVMEVMSKSSVAKIAIETPGPVPEEKVEAIVEEVREKVGGEIRKYTGNKPSDAPDTKDFIDHLVKNNIKATKMLSENINLFAGKDCKGPREIIENIDDVFRFIKTGYDKDMLSKLDRRVEILKDLGKLRDGYDKHINESVIDSADQSTFLEARNSHLILSKSLIPGYYTVAKENSKYSSYDVKEHDLVRLTKEDIVNAKPNFYDQYMYILKNKNDIAAKMEEIANFNDAIKSLNDEIKKYSDKIDGLKKSVDKKRDPKIKEVGGAVVEDFKAMVNTLRSHVTVANACIVFADSLHQSIMQLSDK